MPPFTCRRFPLPRQRRSTLTWPLIAAAAIAAAFASPDVPAAPAAGAAERARAVARVAADDHNACAAIRPFYWEIGDTRGALASGSVRRPGLPDTVEAGTVLAIASASKWLWGAYAVQRRQGVPTEEDIRHLNFRAGYSDFSWCRPGQTVGQCQVFRRNDEVDPRTEGRFDYSGGHMQHHAVLLGLGGLDNAGLARELRSQLGMDIRLTYSQPQPAGGVVTSAEDYARFLRKLLGGELHLGRQLGEHAVCTNRLHCPGQAVHTPVPLREAWHYGLGYWIEDDPRTGDGSFSSAGAFGFYPWITADRSHYGLISRRGPAGSGHASAQCGRLLRDAWQASPP